MNYRCLCRNHVHQKYFQAINCGLNMRNCVFEKMENMYRLIGQTYHTVKIDQRIESLQFKHHDFFYNVVKWLPVYAFIVLERAVSLNNFQIYCPVD